MKIFKLFLCLSLILSISLVNSFAAISVSDGSAFVTKAEFAADLNNLSNRMSSLENSLDAKIDSLVSSYLSRNGIWNGEEQKNLIDKLSLGKSIKFTDSYNNKIYVLELNQKMMEINKSGLLKLNLLSKKRIYMSGTLNAPSSSVGIFSINLFFNSKKISDIKLNTWYTATDASDIVFNNCLSSWKFADGFGPDTSSLFSIARSAFNEYIYFFVNKNDDLYCNVYGMGALRGQAIANTTFSWSDSSTANDYLEFSGVVY